MTYYNQKVKPRQTATPTTQTKDLGIVTNVPMGDWNVATPYMKLNMVRSHGATYQAKKNNQGIEPTVTTGWQDIWQVVAYDGGSVNPDGTYPNMTVGNATNAQNDGTGENISEQFADINDKIPSTASADNQLADKAFVNSSINAMAAFYITYNENGDAFPTRADLLSATTFYSGGQARVPTQNDYAIVRADDSQPAGVDGSYPTTRYSYQGGTYPNGQWSFQYIVNATAFTQAQINALNSGITAELVALIGKGSVISVNGKTGAVEITPESIGAASTSGTYMDFVAGRALDVSGYNWADNPDFNINQRGQTTYIGVGVYTFDRWKKWFQGSVTKISDGVRLTNTRSGDVLQQVLEHTFLIGKTLTFSMQFTYNGQTEIISCTGVLGYDFVQAEMKTWGNIYFGVNSDGFPFLSIYMKTASIDVHYVKFEIGLYTTIFIRPNISVELPKCMRFYYRIGLANGATPIGIGQFNTNNTVISSGLLPTIMRVAPTSRLSSSITIRTNNTYLSSSTFAAYNSPFSFQLQITANGTAPAGNCADLFLTEGNYLEFDAEF